MESGNSARLPCDTGTATEPIVALAIFFLTICTLTGHWWMLGYAIGATLLLGFSLALSIGLEFNTQRILEERRARGEIPS